MGLLKKIIPSCKTSVLVCTGDDDPAELQVWLGGSLPHFLQKGSSEWTERSHGPLFVFSFSVILFRLCKQGGWLGFVLSYKTPKEWKRMKPFLKHFLPLMKMTKKKEIWQSNTGFRNISVGLHQKWHPLALTEVGSEAVLRTGPSPWSRKSLAT